jgi:ethanolamine ammonia-lyase small subunit
MSQDHSPVVANPWSALRTFTDARIALGRAGVSTPTQAHLAFQLAHAQARDAVHLELDAESLARTLDAVFPDAAAPGMVLHSAADKRLTYLQRPDRGRRLDAASCARLGAYESTREQRPFDLALVVVDGLSALAIEKNAAPFLASLRERLAAESWSLAPLCVVQQGRVAIGDEVGQLLGAKAVAVLIGERPGLSSPDSMGLYMTWMPQVGLTDERRNCISNVRPAGLGYGEAAFKLHYLLTQSRQRQISGVDLKDETTTPVNALAGAIGNFLLPPV